MSGLSNQVPDVDPALWSITKKTKKKKTGGAIDLAGPALHRPVNSNKRLAGFCKKKMEDAGNTSERVDKVEGIREKSKIKTQKHYGQETEDSPRSRAHRSSLRRRGAAKS